MPDALGPTPQHASDAGTQFVKATFEQGIGNGFDPAFVAELAIGAVRTGRFLVTTDPAAVEHALESTKGVVEVNHIRSSRWARFEVLVAGN